MPENAATMQVEIFNKYNQLLDKFVMTGDREIEFSADEMEDGGKIIFNMTASNPGYQEAYQGIIIPIIAESNVNAALRLEDAGEDNRVSIDRPMRFVLTPGDGTVIRNAKLNVGYHLQ